MLKKALDGDQQNYENGRRWTKKIKEGGVDIEDTRCGPHHIRPKSDERVDQMKDELSHHRGWSVRQIAEKFGILESYVHEVLTEKLGLKKIMKVKFLTLSLKIRRYFGLMANIITSSCIHVIQAYWSAHQPLMKVGCRCASLNRRPRQMFGEVLGKMFRPFHVQSWRSLRGC